MPTPTVTRITSHKQFKDLLDSNKLFIAYFWASWSGPCKVMMPVFPNLAAMKEFNEKIDFYSVDVDEQEEISAEVGILSMPAFIVFKDGKKIDEVIGGNPPALVTMIQKSIAI